MNEVCGGREKIGPRIKAVYMRTDKTLTGDTFITI
jgi:hypothetical protein